MISVREGVDEYYGSSLSLHRAFWNCEEMRRPLIAVNLGMHAHQHCPGVMTALPPGRISPDDIPVESFLADCDRLHEMDKLMDDDYPFVASPLVYVPWMEAIMGCPVEASPTGIWAERCIDDPDVWEWRKAGADNPWRRKLLDTMTALVRHAEGRYPISATLMRGPADVYAAMRGATYAALDFVDRLETVRMALGLIGDVWVELAKEQHALVPESSRGYMDGDRGLRFWSPEKTTWLQEDAMALLSPTIYRESVLPVDSRIAREFPSLAYHLHDTGAWAIDNLVALPEFHVIELNWEAAVMDPETVLAGWKKVLGNRPLMIWRLYDDEFWPWLDMVCGELSTNSLSIQITVDSLEEGVRVGKNFKERFGS